VLYFSYIYQSDIYAIRTHVSNREHSFSWHCRPTAIGFALRIPWNMNPAGISSACVSELQAVQARRGANGHRNHGRKGQGGTERRALIEMRKLSQRQDRRERTRSRH